MTEDISTYRAVALISDEIQERVYETFPDKGYEDALQVTLPTYHSNGQEEWVDFMGVTIYGSNNDEREWPDDSDTRVPDIKTHLLLQMAHLTVKAGVVVKFLSDKHVLIE
ncbi:hypothetical protein UFOVP75_188 [uncultured Caudovirales phage]|uniref:Uncharacterized protein n=1 Tax=uncultured Caudovirales phage TaxID=2100421 RepID=A0A6J5KZD3_9CAUD|nr:hypothetical protein UFOVP75_188 [uncultured Caudovirales phage]